MAAKTATRVTIGGKTYTLSGNESEEYLQEVASYLNGKIAQLKSDEEYRNVPFDMRNVLLQLNLADDYFKARSEIRKLRKRIDEKEQELEKHAAKNIDAVNDFINSVKEQEDES